MGNIGGQITIGVSLEHVEVVRLMAELEKLKTYRAGMEATNDDRRATGGAPAWCEASFHKIAQQMEDIETQLTKISEELKARIAAETEEPEVPEAPQEVPGPEGCRPLNCGSQDIDRDDLGA